MRKERAVGARVRLMTSLMAAVMAALITSCVTGLVIVAAAGASSPAFAGEAGDSCWMHNGSLMRLIADGPIRRFVYEEPREGLRQIGVLPGTVLFTGYRRGFSYTGIARLFSTECPGAISEYAVEGPVLANQTRIVLSGSREIYRNCQPTDQFVRDTLEFVYVRRC